MKKINGEFLSEDECYQKHFRLIYKALKSILPIAQNVGMDSEDLVSEGKIGFIKAYRKFDDSLGYRFSSFAVRMIKFEALRFIRDRRNVVRIPRTTIELANKINTAGLDVCSVKDIAAKLNESENNVQVALKSMRSVESLSAEMFSDSEKVTLLDQLGVKADFTAVYVNDFMQTLNPLERDVTNMRLEGFTQQEIGESLGFSQVQTGRYIKKISKKYLEQVM